MLSQRASRLDRKDIQAFLRPLAPETRAVEGPIASGSLQVPLDRIEFSVRRAHSSSPKSFRGLNVDLIYRYEQLPPDNVFRIPFDYDLDKKGGVWTVTNSRLDPSAVLPIWATGPVEFARSAHFLALFRPGTPNAQGALAQAEQARARLASKLTFQMDEGHLMLLARNRSEYESLSARPIPVSAVAQEETTFAITPQRIAAESRLIVANLERLLLDTTAIETFQHELAHLALAPYTRPFTPGWVSESAAMYLADTRPESVWLQGLRSKKFDAMSFAQLTPRLALGQHDASGLAASFEYAYAAAAAWYLTETFGPEKYWSFYRSYADLNAGDVYAQIPDGGAGPNAEEALVRLAVTTTNAALQKIYGFGESGLDTRVRVWIQFPSGRGTKPGS